MRTCPSRRQRLRSSLLLGWVEGGNRHRGQYRGSLARCNSPRDFSVSGRSACGNPTSYGVAFKGQGRVPTETTVVDVLGKPPTRPCHVAVDTLYRTMSAATRGAEESRPIPSFRGGMLSVLRLQLSLLRFYGCLPWRVNAIAVRVSHTDLFAEPLPILTHTRASSPEHVQHLTFKPVYLVISS